MAIVFHILDLIVALPLIEYTLHILGDVSGSAGIH